ncbi:hypothetical protein MPER_07085 [Moniliophthora perniciosa FA553]|nr:hypothetical protein MPER_07085 [Moniliophthora perniciosa FA553]
MVEPRRLVFPKHSRAEIEEHFRRLPDRWPLAETDVHTAKVSTSPERDDPKYQHVICLYIPDVYDKDSVTKYVPTGLEKNSFDTQRTALDLEEFSTHERLRDEGSVYRGLELKEQFYTELRAVPKVTAVPAATTSTTTAAASQTKPKLKKKKGKDDPFASDDEGQEASKPAKIGKRAKEGDDDEEQPQKKKANDCRLTSHYLLTGIVVMDNNRRK